MSANDQEPKAIQIIPAVGWYAVFKDASVDGGEVRTPLICWALMDDGAIVGHADVGGYVDEIESSSDFDRYAHESMLVGSDQK